MRAITAFMNGVTKLNDVIGRAVCYLVLPIFAFLILEVFLRYMFNSPTVWTNELTQMLFGVYGVLAGGYLLAHGDHVSVDLFSSQLKPRVRAVIDILGSIIFFIFVLALLYFGYEMEQESVSTWETSYSAWNPPIWPIKVAIPVGAALLLLQGIVKLLQDIAIALNLDYYKPEEGKTGDEL